MEATSPRWKEITPSQFPWERDALTFVRKGLPDHEPYRAWSNFEFIADDGSINEVDLLVFSPKGFFLVEIKSRPGIVEGDAGTWSWHHDGRIYTDDNPLILANRKAKKLKSLLASQKALQKTRAPFLEAQIFLSDESNKSRLPAYLRENVHLRDQFGGDGQIEKAGILAALTKWTSDSAPRRRHDRPLAKAVTRAMEEAGIRPSKRSRRVGDYELKDLLFEGPSYQDWSATHVAIEKERSRVRIYSLELGASQEAQNTIRNAARREYRILSGISHDGILKAKQYTETDRGPALVFEHSEGSQRLDHYLSERASKLTADQRMHILRQLAETIQYAHEQRLIHRALSPQSVLVLDPEAATPRVQIFNWQTGARGSLGTSTTSHGVSATSHLDPLIEDISAVYMAPEALAERGSVGEEQDVFSLGAIAYHLFGGEPPASNFYELNEKLREHRGLKISSVLDGAPEQLELLIQFSTLPEVTGRLESASLFLSELDALEEALTAPERTAATTDPMEARAGDVLEHGFHVVRRLGKGSTALALLVKKDDKEHVLKIALEPSHNERLHAEADVLKKLRHQFIVELYDVLTFGDRVGLVMAKAGETTLAQRLREEGRLGLELLERFGEDLLQTVDWLDKHGVPHRDIKPENLGVAAVGRGDLLHLVLFDFSLTNADPANTRAGTVPYLEPFLSLREQRRWDTHAERFAASMTLYQMATGSLPTWGDGQSDPAVLNDEVTIEAEAFDPSLRERMAEFFGQALRRRYQERYDNAQDMLVAWRQIFAEAGKPAITTEPGEKPTAREVTPVEDAELTTPLVLLNVSTRAMNAIERVGAGTVEELLRVPLPQLSHMRGVGNKTRKEIAQLVKALSERFPDVKRVPLPETRDDKAEEAGVEVATLAIDALAAQLTSSRVPKNAQASQKALETFLRLSPDGPTDLWPSQSDIAREVGVTRARIGQVLSKARKRWLKLPAITHLRDEIVGLLDGAGGVMTATELADAVLTRRGSAQEEPERTREARAVVRAAAEAERDRANPRWVVRRPHDGGRILIARDELDEDGNTRIDGQGLADYAERLGRKASELATADPLLPPDRCLEALLSVPTPKDFTAPSSRVQQLAAATSRTAALSSRLELYPRGMDAARALRLSLGALAGAKELTQDQIRDRVVGRYPEAAALPDRPQLDQLLESVGSELHWRADAGPKREGAFVAPLREFTTVISGTSLPRPTPITPKFEEVSSDEADRKQFHKRLQRSHDENRFLALLVPPRRLLEVQQELASRFPVEVRNLDELLICHMKAFATEKNVDWSRILQADAVPSEQRAGSQDWNNLQRVVGEALRRAQAELATAENHVMLTNLGLLARYDQLNFLDNLRETTGRPAGPEGPIGPPGLWLVVATDAQDERPTIDSKPVPVFSTAQWARVPQSWTEYGDTVRQ